MSQNQDLHPSLDIRVVYNPDLNISAVSSPILCFGGAVPSKQVGFGVRFGFVGSDVMEFARPLEVEVRAYGQGRETLRWSEPEILRGFVFHVWDERNFISACEYDPLRSAGGWSEDVRAWITLNDFYALCAGPRVAFSVSADPALCVFEEQHVGRFRLERCARSRLAFAAFGRRFTAFRPTQQARAQKAGVQLPPEPPRKITREAQFLDGLISHEYQDDNPNFEKQMEARTAARQKILEFERAHVGAAQAAGAATKATTAAINEQSKAVSSLSDRELAAEKKRLEAMNAQGKLSFGKPGYDSGAYLRSLDIQEESQNRASKAHADRERDETARTLAANTAKADAARKTQEATARNEMEAQARADQARADLGRSLQEQLSGWKAFESAVDGVKSSLAQTAESGNEVTGAVARAKMQAQLARTEFDGIPQPLKDSAIALAGIGAQLQKIVGTRDAVRSVFNGIFEGLGGAEASKFSAFVKTFQNDLKLAEQGRALLDQAQSHSATLGSAIDARTGDLSGQIRLNELSGRKPFRDAQNAADGAANGAGNADMVSAARGYVGSTGSDPSIAGKAYGREWCVGFVQTVHSQVTGESLLGGTVSVAELRKRGQAAGIAYQGTPKVGDVMTLRGPGDSHAAVVSKVNGNGTFSTIGGNEGGIRDNYKSQVREGTTYRNNDPRIVFLSMRANAPVPDAVPVAVRPAVAAAASEAAPNSAPNSARKTAAARRPGFDGRLLLARPLPAAYGPSLADITTAPGESTVYREQIEAMLRKLADNGVSIPTKALLDAKTEGRRLDAAKSTKDATRELWAEITSIGRETRLIAAKNNPYLIAEEEFSSGADHLAARSAQNSKAGAVLSLMQAQMKQGTEEAVREAQRSARLTGENNGMLRNGYDSAAYERAQFQTQKRAEIWQAPDMAQMSQTVGKLAVEGKAHQATALQKQINARATLLLSEAMKVYDDQALQSALRGHADQMKALKEEADALQNLIELRSQPGIARGLADDHAAADEMQKKAQEQFAPLVKSGKITPQEAEEMTRDVGELAFANAQAKRSDSQKTSLDDYNAAIKDNIALLADQKRAHESMAVDSPELKTQLALLQERARLLSGDFKDRVERDASGGLVIPDDVKTELDARLKGFRMESEAEANLSRVRDAQTKVQAAQNSVLDQQMERQMNLAKTAKERLDIELRFEALKRQNSPQGETPEEAAARRQVDLERQINAAQTDRIEQTRKNQAQAQSTIRSLIDGDTKGLLDRIRSEAKDAAAQSISKRIFRDPKNPTAQEPDERGPKLGGYTPSFGKEAERWMPTIQKYPGIPQRNSSADIAGSIRSALAGGITAARVEVHSGITSVSGSTVNVANGGNASGLLGNFLGGRRGGSGTTPTVEQSLSNGAMLV